MTDAEHAERTALVSVFPEADTLMCFFHVIKAAEDKLSGNKDRRCDIEGCRIAKRCFTEQERYNAGQYSSFSEFYYLYPFKIFVLTA
jgi:hypothetical protein